MVKLLIQEVLVLLNNYSRILVLLNNYFSFFEFWSNLVKLWSNCCQTPVEKSKFEEASNIKIAHDSIKTRGPGSARMQACTLPPCPRKKNFRPLLGRFCKL